MCNRKHSCSHVKRTRYLLNAKKNILLAWKWKFNGFTANGESRTAKIASNELRKLIHLTPKRLHNLLFISILYKQKQINLFKLDLIANFTENLVYKFFFSLFCVCVFVLQKSLGIKLGALECIAIVIARAHRMGHSKGYGTLTTSIRSVARRCSQSTKAVGKFFNFKSILNVPNIQIEEKTLLVKITSNKFSHWKWISLRSVMDSNWIWILSGFVNDEQRKYSSMTFAMSTWT